eukprot:scaffold172203_cov43-Prasinocladus_malaysianus.AAC.1
MQAFLGEQVATTPYQGWAKALDFSQPRLNLAHQLKFITGLGPFENRFSNKGPYKPTRYQPNKLAGLKF